ncbi:MAG: iron chelate uptake ABC transporter family permease subunit, partial [Clostridia bacterium]|nr:iron chelate uptake ABC transporter family permease subunit [Clostridia bacterium]
SIPHLARMITQTDNHRILLPTSAILGAICASLCLFISTLPNNGSLLPINALTPIFGIPIILYILLTPKVH